MTRRKSEAPPGKDKQPAAQPCANGLPASSADQIARNVLNPSILAANTIVAVLPVDATLDIPALAGALGEQALKANNGDLSRAESMLMGQAHTLNALFTALTRRAVAQEYLNQYETYMRLALKAQSQCRATIETLALMKNPQPVTFVRQANVAHGPQQVNNVPQPTADAASRARESENSQNKLLEQQHGERLDPGATTAAIGADSAVAALAEIHRSDNCRR